MRLLLLCILCSAVLFFGVADAAKNSSGVWTLHYAGTHDPEASTCDFLLSDCMGQLEVNAPAGPGRYDIYVIATDVGGIARTSFGVSCEGGDFLFYGWTGCSDAETPGTGWPGCGEGLTLGWASEQVGPNVTLGILDVYAYGVSSICAGPDPRTGEAEYCDGTVPEPICVRLSDVWRFGCVGFGESGYQSCPAPLPQTKSTWGVIKSLYVD